MMHGPADFKFSKYAVGLGHIMPYRINVAWVI